MKKLLKRVIPYCEVIKRLELQDHGVALMVRHTENGNYAVFIAKKNIALTPNFNAHGDGGMIVGPLRKAIMPNLLQWTTLANAENRLSQITTPRIKHETDNVLKLENFRATQNNGDTT